MYGDALLKQLQQHNRIGFHHQSLINTRDHRFHSEISTTHRGGMQDEHPHFLDIGTAEYVLVILISICDRKRLTSVTRTLHFSGRSASVHRLTFAPTTITVTLPANERITFPVKHFDIQFAVENPSKIPRNIVKRLTRNLHV